MHEVNPFSRFNNEIDHISEGIADSTDKLDRIIALLEEHPDLFEERRSLDKNVSSLTSDPRSRELSCCEKIKNVAFSPFQWVWEKKYWIAFEAVKLGLIYYLINFTFKNKVKVDSRNYFGDQGLS